MEKTPCIECTSRLWEYIKPYLEKWGYFTDCGNIVDRVGEELVLFIDKSEKAWRIGYTDIDSEEIFEDF